VAFFFIFFFFSFGCTDLVKLGGLEALSAALDHISAQVRTSAAWVLGVAAQNNPKVQKEVSTHCLGNKKQK